MKTTSRFLMLAGTLTLLMGCVEERVPSPAQRGRMKEEAEKKRQWDEEMEKNAQAENRMYSAFDRAIQRQIDGESYDHWKKRQAQDEEDKKQALLKNAAHSNTPSLQRNVSMPACSH